MIRFYRRAQASGFALSAVLGAASIAGAQEPEPSALESAEPAVAPVSVDPAPPAPAPPLAPTAAPSAPAPTPARARARAPSLAPYPAADAAPAPDAEPVDAAELWTSPPGVPRIEAWIGLGNVWVPSDAFDAFADDDALTGVSVGAALRLGSTEGSGVRLVATWDTAGRSDAYRGQSSSLDVMRFGLGPELQLPLFERLDLHLRGAASAVSLSAELEETSSGATLSDSAWGFGVEGAVGATFRFADLHAQRSRLAFLLRAEAGYGWVAGHELSLSGGDAPRRSEALALGDLALGGPLVRVSIGAGF